MWKPLVMNTISRSHFFLIDWEKSEKTSETLAALIVKTNSRSHLFLIYREKTNEMWTPDVKTFALLPRCSHLSGSIIYDTRLETMCGFLQGAQLHPQKLLKGVVYRNQYIFGLHAEIWGSCRRILLRPAGSPLQLVSRLATSLWYLALTLIWPDLIWLQD